jgi:hypothetical protein
MPRSIENQGTTLLNGEQLHELVSEGMAAEFYPEEGYGTITLLGLERVVRHGNGLSIVELYTDEIHRGILVPNQITSGGVIRVKNSGGIHKSPVIGDHHPRLMDGDRFRDNFRMSHTPRHRSW